MKRLLLLIAFLIVSVPGLAQRTGNPGTGGAIGQGVLPVAALPTLCTAVGSDSSSSPVRYRGNVYICSATNTWTQVGTGGGSITGLTATRVPVAASATTLTDSADFVYVTATSRLGLVAAAPQFTLDVNGNARVISTLFIGGTNGVSNSNWNIFSTSGIYNITENAVADYRFTIRPTTGFVGINAGATAGAQLQINTSATTAIGQIIKGAASQSANLTEWQDSTGAVLAKVTATGSITASVNINVGSATLNASNLTLTNSILTAGSSVGVFILYNSSQTDFNRLSFGGTTSSFPSLKRSGTALQARLADDSAYAPVAASYYLSSNSYSAGGYWIGTGPGIGTGSVGLVGGTTTIATLVAGTHSALSVHDGSKVQLQYNMKLGWGTAADTENDALDTAFYRNAAGIAEVNNGTANQYRDLRTRAQGVGIAPATGTYALGVTPSATTEIGLVVKGAASQSANLTEWQNSSGTVLISAGPAGVVTIAQSSGAYGLIVNNIVGKSGTDFYVNGPSANSLVLGGHAAAEMVLTGTGLVRVPAAQVFGWSSTSDAASVALDTGLSRISAGVIGVGTGAAGSTAGSLSMTNLTLAGQAISTGIAFASLGTPANGSFTYCTDCQVTSGADNTATSGGTGAFVVRLNGVWRAFATQN